MAKVPNGLETLPKISIGWVVCTNVTDDRQTDRRQTDGRTTTYSEHEHEFTFAKNVTQDFSPISLVMFTVGEKVRYVASIVHCSRLSVILVSKWDVRNNRWERRIRCLRI